jgi:hypothetical protein
VRRKYGVLKLMLDLRARLARIPFIVIAVPIVAQSKGAFQWLK